MVSVNNDENGNIVIGVDGKTETININQANKLRRELYNAIGISLDVNGIKIAQQRIEDRRAGKFVEHRNKKPEKKAISEIYTDQELDEKLKDLKLGSKVVLK